MSLVFISLNTTFYMKFSKESQIKNLIFLINLRKRIKKNIIYKLYLRFGTQNFFEIFSLF